MKKYIDTKLFFTGLFSAFLITGNFMAGKLISVFGFTVPAAVILFPFCFTLGDIINEQWGLITTKTVIINTFIFNAAVIALTSLAALMPAVPFSQVSTEAYNAVFLSAPRMLLASVTAFAVSGFLNASVFDRFKKRGARLSIRAALSTTIGILVDSLIFLTIAFIGVMPIKELMLSVVGQSLIKLILGVAVGVPLTLLAKLCIEALRR